jgi:hypothetical protein
MPRCKAPASVLASDGNGVSSPSGSSRTKSLFEQALDLCATSAEREKVQRLAVRLQLSENASEWIVLVLHAEGRDIFEVSGEKALAAFTEQLDRIESAAPGARLGPDRSAAPAERKAGDGARYQPAGSGVDGGRGDDCGVRGRGGAVRYGRGDLRADSGGVRVRGGVDAWLCGAGAAHWQTELTRENDISQDVRLVRAGAAWRRPRSGCGRRNRAYTRCSYGGHVDALGSESKARTSWKLMKKT